MWFQSFKKFQRLAMTWVLKLRNSTRIFTHRDMKWFHSSSLWCESHPTKNPGLKTVNTICLNFAKHHSDSYLQGIGLFNICSSYICTETIEQDLRNGGRASQNSCAGMWTCSIVFNLVGLHFMLCSPFIAATYTNLSCTVCQQYATGLPCNSLESSV